MFIPVLTNLNTGETFSLEDFNRDALKDYAASDDFERQLAVRHVGQLGADCVLPGRRVSLQSLLAVGADGLCVAHDEAAVATGARLRLAQRRTASQAGGLAHRVCRVTIFTHHAAQALG